MYIMYVLYICIYNVINDYYNKEHLLLRKLIIFKKCKIHKN